MLNRPDLVGKVFGRLTVIKQLPSRNHQRHWLCQCVCGNTSTPSTNALNKGNSESCGCLQRDRTSEASIQHGEFSQGNRTPSTEYGSWKNMMNRCSNPKSQDYHNYGGRGITVFERWKTYKNFLLDMGRKPSPAHSIERIDNNGNYEPGNVRWATRTEQNSNMRRTILVCWDDHVMPLTKAAPLFGIGASTAVARHARGWSICRALTEPPQVHKRAA